MRPPRVRITLRWLMGIIAIVALLIWGEKMLRLRASHLDKAAIYRADANRWRGALDRAEAEIASSRKTQADFDKNAEGADPAVLESRAQVAEFTEDIVKIELETARESRHRYDEAARLTLKYERAARYPWLSITPDPLPAW